MKLKVKQADPILLPVAPCAGAGIEINQVEGNLVVDSVAPCAGAGIEISPGRPAKR